MINFRLHTLEYAFEVAFDGRENVGCFCPFHENPATSSQSCSVSVKGVFRCHAPQCNAKGNAVSFYAQRNNLTYDQALNELKEVDEDEHEYTAGTYDSHYSGTGGSGVGNYGDSTGVPATSSIIDENIVQKYKTMLNTHQRSKDLLGYLKQIRGLSDEIIDKHNLGFDGQRYTIPVYNANGQCINIRRYKPNGKPKMLSIKGKGSTFIYPINQINFNEPIVLCEGEMDCLLLHSLGINAATLTGKAWLNIKGLFADTTVYLVFDVNDTLNAGGMLANRAYKELSSVSAIVYKVTLPLGTKYRGGDVKNYIIDEGHSKKEFEELLYDASADSSTLTVALQDLQNVSAQGVLLETTCTVVSKSHTAFALPRGVTCGGQRFEVPQNADLNLLLQCIESTDKAKDWAIRNILGITNSQEYTITDICPTFIVYCIPQSVVGAANEHSYVSQKMYVANGASIQAGRTYTFTGYTASHPKTQELVFFATSYSFAQEDLDTFEVTPQLHNGLTVFQPEIITAEDIYAKLEHIADYIYEAETRIHGRRELHILMDLVYHSCLTFNFEGQQITRGWLELLVIGDTRTGKGYIANGLQRVYNAGEMLSGENLTLAGLLGGVMTINGNQFIKWGKLALNDRRLCIMDECSGIPKQIIGRLSRVRSEGVAEVTKIVSEATMARTRLIWIGNPRKGSAGESLSIHDFNKGIDAITDLIGDNEDIARFDIVYIAAKDDVSVKTINSVHTFDVSAYPYSSHLLQQLLLFCWSLTPDKIIFEEGVEEYLYSSIEPFVQQFDSSLPLIQAEDARIKILRLAIAIAGRTYSTTDGEFLQVCKAHIECAMIVLHRNYALKSNGYCLAAQVTEPEIAGVITTEGVEQPRSIAEIALGVGGTEPDILDGLAKFNDVNEQMLHAAIGMYIENPKVNTIKAYKYILSTTYITMRTIEDALACDSFIAKVVLSRLVLAGLLKNVDRDSYRKTRNFINALKLASRNIDKN